MSKLTRQLGLEQIAKIPKGIGRKLRDMPTNRPGKLFLAGVGTMVTAGLGSAAFGGAGAAGAGGAAKGGAAAGAAGGAAKGGAAAGAAAGAGGKAVSAFDWISLGANALSAGASFVQGNKESKRQDRLAQQSLDLTREEMDRIQEVVDQVDPTKMAMAQTLATAYVQTSAMLDEAVKRGDTKLETIYSDQLKVMDEHAKNELGLAPRQYQDFKEMLDSQASKALDLVRSDIRANNILKREYKKQADTAVDTYEKGLISTQARIDAMRKRGGLPEGSEQALAKQEAAITEAKQNLARAEGLKLGGARARRLGLDVEAARAKGDLVAQLRATGRAENLSDEQNKLNIAGGLEDVGAKRMRNLQETAGAQELAARAPFMEASQRNLSRLQDTEADIATQKRAQPISQAAGFIGLDQWGLGQKAGLLTRTGATTASIADLLNNQATLAGQRAAAANQGMMTSMSNLGRTAYDMWGEKPTTQNRYARGGSSGQTGVSFGDMGRTNSRNLQVGETQEGSYLDNTRQFRLGQYAGGW